jgi:hypothetical protein
MSANLPEMITLVTDRASIAALSKTLEVKFASTLLTHQDPDMQYLDVLLTAFYKLVCAHDEIPKRLAWTPFVAALVCCRRGVLTDAAVAPPQRRRRRAAHRP